MSEKACFFIGHRSFIPKYDRAAAKNLRILIAYLAEEGVSHFYAGGSTGWDMFCARSVLMMKQYYPQLKLHLILPCPPEKQSSDWTVENKLVYNVIFDSASSVEIVSSDLTKESLQERNQRLVEECEICICYFRRGRYRSITGHAIRTARKAKRSVINMCTKLRNT